MKILLAEDDEHLGLLLTRLLKRQNINVKWAKDGEEAYELVYKDNYDVLVFDWMMPKLSGIDLLKRLRGEKHQGKILLLTAKDAIQDRVAGLNSGADDYLVKPFDVAELVARLYALCRRKEIYTSNTINHRGYVLDANSYSLNYKDKSVELRAKEYKLLEFLMINKGQIIPRDFLLDRIWGLESDVTDNNLDVHIRMLRKKISSLNDEDLITTVRGVGYCVK
ncbi:MAG: response regulator transcription factor [bacterium]|nr:response regulator transcription factor [bacterium]